MTRTKSTERLSLRYERVVEHESDDGNDQHPSFAMPIVTTDGEAVDEITLPLPLSKCRAVSRARKVS